MKSGICPKCGSDEVYKNKPQGYTVIPISWLHIASPIAYVCTDCGHVEWYIEERDKLETIREKWLHTTEKHKRKRGE